MPLLHVSIVNKIATYQQRDGAIVCNNSDYKIEFSFDKEWNDLPYKTARFSYLKGSELVYQDVMFEGNIVNVPPLYKTKAVAVGVYAGELHTSTPATIPCRLSIICESGEPTIEEDPETLSQIMQLLNIAVTQQGIAVEAAETAVEASETAQEAAQVATEERIKIESLVDGADLRAESIVFVNGVKTTYDFGKIKPKNGQVLEIVAPGGTLAQVFEALVDEMNPTTIQPSASITLNDAKAYEVGSTFTPVYSVTFDKGSYTYDDDTGVTETSRTITDSNGNNPPFAAFTVGDNTNYKLSAVISHTDGIIPHTNMGNEYSAGQIKAGDATATSKAVTGYRNTFYGTLTNKNELTSTVVRGLTKSNKALSNGSSFTIDIPLNAMMVVFAYPDTLREVTKVDDVNASYTDITDSFKKNYSVMSVEGAGGYPAINYRVYALYYAKPNDKANKYMVTI